MEQREELRTAGKLPPAEGAIIYGAGGHARELRDQMQSDGWIVHAFIDDFDHSRNIGDQPVLSFDEAYSRHPAALWFIAIGDHKVRRIMADRLLKQGLQPGIFISRDAMVSPSTQIEPGVQIFARTVISSGTRLGRYAIANFSCVLSHDVEVDSFTTISPGVHVAGNVHVMEGAFIGVGACIKNGSSNRKLIIGPESVIGAGACVVNDVHNETVVVGVPARIMGKYR
ncbi:acetyltransferase [Pseudochelatococcus sp. G4_1912]|uniref:acetyltransferase n=1 Tax=Pseudochelatococcus sp. G4_1912 TaxID=3114288 RepID=UPI0039C71D50